MRTISATASVCVLLIIMAIPAIGDPDKSGPKGPQAEAWTVSRPTELNVAMLQAEGDTDVSAIEADFGDYRLLFMVSPDERDEESRLEGETPGKMTLDAVLMFDELTGQLEPWDLSRRDADGESTAEGAVAASDGSCASNSCGGACCVVAVGSKVCVVCTCCVSGSCAISLLVCQEAM